MFVICTLPNASLNINGIEFEEHKEGVVSKEAVPADVADRFAGIAGYKLVKSKTATKEEKPVEPAAEAPAAEEAAEAPAAEKTRGKK